MTDMGSILSNMCNRICVYILFAHFKVFYATFPWYYDDFFPSGKRKFDSMLVAFSDGSDYLQR